MRVLSIVHEPAFTGGGGLFERLVEERGHRLVRWHPPDGGAAPGEPGAWDAVMVFGGAMHPDSDSDNPWLPGETAFVERTLRDGVPLLGVCLGAQLVARAAGAAVGPAARSEVGWYRVDVGDEGARDPVIGVLPRTVQAFQWHHYTFELPDGASLLATSDAARQAFRLGDRTWAVQFHPEVERQMIERWLAEGEDEVPKPTAEVRAETDAHLGAWNRHGRALCAAFLDVAGRLAAGGDAQPDPVSAGRLGSLDHSCHEPT